MSSVRRGVKGRAPTDLARRGAKGWTVAVGGALIGAAVLLAGCPEPAGPPPAASVVPERSATTAAPTASAAGSTSAYSEAVSGLRIRLALPPGPHRVGDRLEVALHFRNDSTEPRRIYLLRSEPFRYPQSTLTVRQPGRVPKPSATQPRPRPHGIVVTEEDFHLIEPGTERRFSQTVVLTKGDVVAGGSCEIEWRYQNEIEQWKGGVQTLDGPTKELFGGQPIPHIWLGKLRVATTIPLAP